MANTFVPSDREHGKTRTNVGQGAENESFLRGFMLCSLQASDSRAGLLVSKRADTRTTSMVLNSGRGIPYGVMVQKATGDRRRGTVAPAGPPSSRPKPSKLCWARSAW